MTETEGIHMKKSDFDRLVKKWKEGTASAQEEESLFAL